MLEFKMTDQRTKQQRTFQGNLLSVRQPAEHNASDGIMVILILTPPRPDATEHVYQRALEMLQLSDCVPLSDGQGLGGAK